MWESRGAYRVYGGKTEGKRLLGRPSRGCEHNIKPDVQELE